MFWILFFCASTTACAVTFKSFESIDFQELMHSKKKVVLEYKSETNLYCTRDRSLFIKIWDTSYTSGTSYFYDAFKKGFYDKLCPTVLQSILIDKNNICRGYICKSGELIHEKESISIEPVNLRDRIVLPFAVMRKQKDPGFIFFYKLLLEATANTGYVFVDWTPFNMVYADEQYQLIDLDEIRPRHKLSNDFYANVCLPSDYRSTIKNSR